MLFGGRYCMDSTLTTTHATPEREGRHQDWNVLQTKASWKVVLLSKVRQVQQEKQLLYQVQELIRWI